MGQHILKEEAVNKSELAGAIAGRLGVSRKDATAAVDAVLEEITTAVAQGEKVSLTGFGVFDKKERQARMARNPRTGESVQVDKSSAPVFRAGQAFKDAVAGRA
jgi:DNA-binding protein HU-beta